MIQMILDGQLYRARQRILIAVLMDRSNRAREYFLSVDMNRPGFIGGSQS